MRFNCKAFSQLLIKGERPLVGGTISGLVVLGSIREQAEQARRGKPVKNIPPWPLHQLLLPDLFEFQSLSPNRLGRLASRSQISIPVCISPILGL